MNWEQITTNLINWCMTEGVKIVIAFVVLFISFFIINCVVKSLRKILTPDCMLRRPGFRWGRSVTV